MRYLKLYFSFLKINLIREIQFRTNFFIYLFTIFLGFLGNLLFYHFLYNNVDSIGGWNRYELYILVATTIIIDSIFGGIFFFNVILILRKIKTYDLDYLLLKPVNTIFYLTFREFNLGLFSGIFFGLALLIYSVIKLGLKISFFNIVAYIILIKVGVLILYSILLFMITFALRFVKVNGLIQSFWSMMSIGKNPYSIYPNILRYIAVFIIPSIVVYNFPAMALIGKGEVIRVLVIGVLIAAFFVGAAIMFFKKNLKYYYN